MEDFQHRKKTPYLSAVGIGTVLKQIKQWNFLRNLFPKKGFYRIEDETDSKDIFIKEIVQHGAKPKFDIGDKLTINDEKITIIAKKETNTPPNTISKW